MRKELLFAGAVMVVALLGFLSWNRAREDAMVTTGAPQPAASPSAAATASAPQPAAPPSAAATASAPQPVAPPSASATAPQGETPKQP